LNGIDASHEWSISLPEVLQDIAEFVCQPHAQGEHDRQNEARSAPNPNHSDNEKRDKKNFKHVRLVKISNGGEKDIKDRVRQRGIDKMKDGLVHGFKNVHRPNLTWLKVSVTQ